MGRSDRSGPSRLHHQCRVAWSLGDILIGSISQEDFVMQLKSLVTLSLVICQCVGVSHRVGQRGVSSISASGVNSALPSTVWGSQISLIRGTSSVRMTKKCKRQSTHRPTESWV